MKFLIFVSLLSFIPASGPKPFKIYACVSDIDYDMVMTEVSDRKLADWCLVKQDCSKAEIVIRNVQASGFPTYITGTESTCQSQ